MYTPRVRLGHTALPAFCALLLPLLLAVAPRGASAQVLDPASIYQVGLQQLEEGDVENALNSFRKVLELTPPASLAARAHASLGYIFLGRDSIDLAGAHFERALAQDSDLATAHNGRGLIQTRDARTRPQAISSFQRALQIDPDYLEARFNLGVTYTEMEQFTQARNAFNAVLARDDNFRDIHYRLGLIAMRARDWETAERHFIEQYRRNSAHLENRLELGRVYAQTERYEEAEQLLLPMIELYPDFHGPKIVLADVYLAVEDYERANQLYLMSFREFNDEETARRLWRDVVDIATEAERREYAATPLERMPEFFRRFWVSRDLNPTTPINEVMVEHYRRLRYVRQHFGTPTTPGGYDDRGRIYLKHGPPDLEVGSTMGDNETRANLTWSYTQGRHEHFIIHFVDRGYGVFNEATSLMEASMRNPLYIRPTPEEGEAVPIVSELWVDQVPINMYRERGIIHPMFDVIANAMEELHRTATSQEGGTDSARPLQDKLFDQIDRERMETMRFLAELDRTTTYVNIRPADPLPFHFYTAAFRDIQGKTKVEVYYGIPTTDLSLERYGAGQRASVELGVAVFDRQWNEVSRSNEIREFLSSTQVQQGLGLSMVDLNRIVVSPGTYNFAISVKDVATGRVGVYKDSLRVADFGPTRQLSLSDIQMAGDIRPSRTGGRFYRDGLEIIPMPSRTYTTEQPIWIYYEIYNLAKDEYGTAEFLTSYTIGPSGSERRGNIISSTLRALGGLVGLGGRSSQVTVDGESEFSIRTNENKYLELAFPTPSPGIYTLTLTIKDRVAGTEAQRSQQFMVTPPPR